MLSQLIHFAQTRHTSQAFRLVVTVLELLLVAFYAHNGRWGFALLFAAYASAMSASIAVTATVDYLGADYEPSD